MENLVLKQKREGVYGIAILTKGLQLYRRNKDGEVITATYNGESFNVLYPDGMLILSESLSPLTWMNRQQLIKEELMEKFIGFNCDKIVSYCQSSYDLKINPLPELRKMFPQHVWSFSCTIFKAEKGVTVHLVDGVVMLSWGSDCFKSNNQTINKIFKSEEI